MPPQRNLLSFYLPLPDLSCPGHTLGPSLSGCAKLTNFGEEPKLTLRTYRSLKFRSALLMLLVDFSFAFPKQLLSLSLCRASRHCSFPFWVAATGSIGLDFISGDAGKEEQSPNCIRPETGSWRIQWAAGSRRLHTHTHTH